MADEARLVALDASRRAEWRVLGPPRELSLPRNRVEISDHARREKQRDRLEILAKMGDG
jgi:hypothetical protein